MTPGAVGVEDLVMLALNCCGDVCVGSSRQHQAAFVTSWQLAVKTLPRRRWPAPPAARSRPSPPARHWPVARGGRPST